MIAFYARWGVFLLITLVLTWMTYQNYQQHLASVSPTEMVTHPSDGTIRLQGMVQPGTLQGNPEEGSAQFTIGDGRTTIPVQYNGPPPDNLREFKTLILIGRWNPDSRLFQARDIALLPHYGFVASAYLVGLVPLFLFVFWMGRKVNLLYEEIKQSKRYQVE